MRERKLKKMKEKKSLKTTVFKQEIMQVAKKN